MLSLCVLLCTIQQSHVAPSRRGVGPDALTAMQLAAQRGVRMHYLVGTGAWSPAVAVTANGSHTSPPHVLTAAPPPAPPLLLVVAAGVAAGTAFGTYRSSTDFL